ncbi:hypothetical protein [Benzoatithermus flavus]|uniref:Uncharacterized protein n=1 Tax=Benzoatithermus flavus TaxID=3108223 RepID=A0ABU8XT79_9PROT
MTYGTDHRERGHLLAFLLGALVVIAWMVGLAVTLAIAGAKEERSGTLLAVFPRGLGETEVLARVAHADGVVMRGTWLANVWQVHGEGERFAGALRAQGAMLVLPPLPYDSFGAGGCGYGAVEPLKAPRVPVAAPVSRDS